MARGRLSTYTFREDSGSRVTERVAKPDEFSFDTAHLSTAKLINIVRAKTAILREKIFNLLRKLKHGDVDMFEYTADLIGIIGNTDVAGRMQHV